MPNLIISVNENTLKLGLNDPKFGFSSTSLKLSNDITSGSTILNSELFSQSLSGLISELPNYLKQQSRRFTLNFLVEPQDIILKFVTVTKKAGAVDEQIISEVKDKLGNVSIDELYFSYRKIAPFVYQFIAVKKDIIEKYIEVSNILGMDLHSVIPWVSLLPKFINKNEPCIFVSKDNNHQTVVLSELNGIYFCGVYEKEKTSMELEQLVHELSIYKRSTPINKIYTMDSEAFSLDPSYDVISLYVPGYDVETTKGFEAHLLSEAVLSTDPDLLSTQLNLLNLLPVPVVVKKNTSLVYVGGAVCLVVLLLGIFSLVKVINNKNDANSSLAQGDAPVVLSETDSQPESTPSQTTPTADLKKSDLKIRIENGAGIAGIAGQAKTYLEGLGYVVPEVGNADSIGRTNTLIKLKTDKMVYKDLLVADMKEDHELVVEDGLDASLDYDVLIVLGND